MVSPAFRAQGIYSAVGSACDLSPPANISQSETSIVSPQFQQLPKLHPKHDPTCPEFVDECRWCITRADLDHFEEEVKKALLDGTLTKDPNHEDKGFDDEKVGPNIHNVCRCVIKPVTAAAGGMSWALMKNENGVYCELFASHCWDEGVFEVIEKLKRAWPQDKAEDQRKAEGNTQTSERGMYICFLANPQNGDISSLLDKRLPDTSFAKALDRAACMTVVPNKTTNIYSRLWCVYELYLALTMIEDGRKLKVSLGWIPSLQSVIYKTLPKTVSMFLPAFSISFFILWPYIGRYLGPVMWMLVTFLFTSFVAFLLRCAEQFELKIRVDSRQWNNISYVWAHIEILVVGFSAGLAYGHLLGHIESQHDQASTLRNADPNFAYLVGRAGGGNSTSACVQWEQGETLPVTLILISITAYYLWKIFTGLVQKVVLREGNALQESWNCSGTDVQKAQCSDKKDQERIMNCIKGKEKDINELVDLLKAIGRYDRNVSFLLKKGMEPTVIRDGVNPFKMCLGCMAFEFWWITELMANSCYYLAVLLPLASITLLLSVVYLATTLSAFSLSAHQRRVQADDRFIWAVHMIAYWGVFFLVISNHPYFFTIDTVNRKRMSIRTMWLHSLCMLGMILSNLFFYCGAYKRVKDQIAQWKDGILESCGCKGEEKTDEEEDEEGDETDDEELSLTMQPG